MIRAWVALAVVFVAGLAATAPAFGPFRASELVGRRDSPGRAKRAPDLKVLRHSVHTLVDAKPEQAATQQGAGCPSRAIAGG